MVDLVLRFDATCDYSVYSTLTTGIDIGSAKLQGICSAHVISLLHLG
jgi:hypothetical protein